MLLSLFLADNLIMNRRSTAAINEQKQKQRQATALLVVYKQELEKGILLIIWNYRIPIIRLGISVFEERRFRVDIYVPWDNLLVNKRSMGIDTSSLSTTTQQRKMKVIRRLSLNSMNYYRDKFFSSSTNGHFQGMTQRNYTCCVGEKYHHLGLALSRNSHACVPKSHARYPDMHVR